MVLYINQTGSVGIIYNAITINITGSEFITMLSILLFFILVLMMFRIPFEMISIAILPVVLIFMAFSGSFFTIAGLLLFYSAIILARNWFA